MVTNELVNNFPSKTNISATSTMPNNAKQHPVDHESRHLAFPLYQTDGA